VAELDRSDSAFLAEETHAVTTVEEAGREGWAEHQDTVRFGAYGFSVVQRLDPATGLPAPAQRWGDTFVGIAGKEPASYMASNWSPWDFLACAVRLRGDDTDVPQPTRMGLLIFCGLTEITRDRVMAEAVWEDAAQGLKRARFVGWRGVDRFGLALSYTPPEGREVESVRYVLTCQPYDYADRGYWERRRCVLTPADNQLVAEGASLGFDPSVDSRFVFHNRFAQNDAGTVLAVDPERARAVTVTGAGNTLTVSATPADPGAEVVMVLGDWVDEAYARAAAGFIAAAEAVSAELAQTASAQAAPSPTDPSEEAEIADLLRDYPKLAAEFGVKVKDAQAGVAAAAAGLARAGTTPSARLQVAAACARRELVRLYTDVRAEWVKGALWVP
jgi:hypothetical protein